VYSHPSKVDFIAAAKGLGYEIVMVLIHLETPDLNQARIASRVAGGGHPVPFENVISRIPRTLEHVRRTIPQVEVLQVYDNSSALDPFRPVFAITSRGLQRHQEPLQGWAAALIATSQH
jgi:predicted ABC-type ATPase